MKIVADTNTFLAVAMNEPEKRWLIEATSGHELVAPDVLPFEIGKALSSLVRRDLVSENHLASVWDATARIAVELRTVDVRAALLLAGHFRIYAYDAYFLKCAMEVKAPLLTLDRGMKRIAKELKIRVLEEQ
jgi:predicted nucleic acid-binding protein